MSIIKLARYGLQRIGFDLVRYPPLPLAWTIETLMLNLNINCVLDVGAYHGSFCKMLRQHANYKGAICSFEPCAESFNRLSSVMINDKSWSGYQVGLSDKDAEAVLNTYDAGDFNSLLSLRDKDALAYDLKNEPKPEPIQLRKLDSMWSEITESVPEPRVFIKIDTQGHDAKVLLGAAEHLKEIFAIQSELPAIEIYDGMTSMADSLRLFKELGYTPIGFFPVNTPTSYCGAVPEFDVLFLRYVNSTKKSEANL